MVVFLWILGTENIMNEHTEIKRSNYICELSYALQEKIESKVKEALTELGYNGNELKSGIRTAMNGRISDLKELIKLENIL